jgi:hypothetical protein
MAATRPAKNQSNARKLRATVGNRHDMPMHSASRQAVCKPRRAQFSPPALKGARKTLQLLG